MTATFKALLVVLSAPSAHAVSVHVARQQEFPPPPALPGQIPTEVLADERKALLQLGPTEEEIQEAKATNPDYILQDAGSICSPGSKTSVMASNHDASGCATFCASDSSCTHFYVCTTNPGCMTCQASGFAILPLPGCDVYALNRQDAPDTTSDVVSGTGDPHLRNLRGEQFDIYQPGKVTLLRLPRVAEDARTLLLVEADARRMGDVCSIYFQVVTISGMWTNESKPIQFLANPHGAPEGRNWNKWMRFGSIELKVAHQTKGVDYLNVYARNVRGSGYEVGGLLGLDDHAAVAKRPSECAHRHAAALSSSTAAAL